jgi:hypothetical protein
MLGCNHHVNSLNIKQGEVGAVGCLPLLDCDECAWGCALVADKAV